MRAFVLGIAVMTIISVGAWFVLTQELDYSAAAVYQSDHGSVRLSPGMGERPGHDS